MYARLRTDKEHTITICYDRQRYDIKAEDAMRLANLIAKAGDQWRGGVLRGLGDRQKAIESGRLVVLPRRA